MNNESPKLISASMMCANLLNMERDIRTLENAGIDYLHLDVMDAHFVPNLTFGPDLVKATRAATNIPLDIHLLMENPMTIIPSLDIHPNEIVSVHSECHDNLMEAIALVKQHDAKFGLVLNPDTKVEDVTRYLPYTDVLLLMLIVPGFAGSTMLHGMMDKVAATKHFLIEHGFDNILIEVDGSVSAERAQKMAAMGANIFVGGTSGIFKKELPIEETVKIFRESIGK